MDGVATVLGAGPDYHPGSVHVRVLDAAGNAAAQPGLRRTTGGRSRGPTGKHDRGDAHVLAHHGLSRRSGR